MSEEADESMSEANEKKTSMHTRETGNKPQTSSTDVHNGNQIMGGKTPEALVCGFGDDTKT